jgi:hypothetical protein
MSEVRAFQPFFFLNPNLRVSPSPCALAPIMGAVIGTFSIKPAYGLRSILDLKEYSKLVKLTRNHRKHAQDSACHLHNT